MKGLRRQISLPKFYRDKTDFARTRFHESSCLQGIIHKRSKQQCPKIANLRAFRLETDTLVPKPSNKEKGRFVRLRKLSRPLSRTSTDDRKAGSD